MNAFKVTSKTGVGLVIYTILKFILPALGFEADEDSIMGVVDAVGVVIAFGLMLYGQWDRKDLQYGIFRK